MNVVESVWRCAMFGVLALLMVLGSIPALAQDEGNQQQPTAPDSPSVPVPPEWWSNVTSARETQSAMWARLRVLGDAFTCQEARFVAYRRSTAESEIVDQWYVASQLWADAVLLGFRQPDAEDADAETRCHLDKGFVFLDRLWDYERGGYFPRSNPTGQTVERVDRYADDNALGGLALLDAARARSDASTRARYLFAARREADFLTSPQSGLWDDTFGGGFWWNTTRGATQEGKPAQTNAIAALFFARLYEATGEPTYRDWALRTLLWMDTILWDGSRGLYRWSVHYADLGRRTGAVVSPRLFNYDQGIAVEAQLAAARIDGSAARVERARLIGSAIHPTFWDAEHGGYNLEAGVPQVYTSYAAWTSLGHLALYDVDHDPRWLDLARQNAFALGASLGEPDLGYAARHYVCRDRLAPGCQSGNVPWVVDQTRDTAAQAWAQHLKVAIASRVRGEAQDPA